MAAHIGGVMVAPICIRAVAGGAVRGYTAGPRRETPARPPEDRPAGRGVAGQGRRTPDAAPQLRATRTDPAAARPDPLPDRPGQGAYRGEPVEKLLEDAQIKLSRLVSSMWAAAACW